MTIDASEFRAKQRDQWNVAAGGWRKWNELIDAGTSEVSARLVALAGVQPGHRVLDVACGYGEPSLTAARAAAPGGSVTATDISAQMIAFGRERAAAAGVENIEWVESGVSDLDYPDDTFDAAVSRFGIIFDPDGEGSAGHVRAFLKPGARFAIASWGTPDEVPFLSIPMRTAMQKLDVPPPPPGTPGPLSRPTPEALGGLLEGGGFGDVQVERMEVSLGFASPEEFTTFVREIAPPISSMIEPHPQDVQDATWAAITDAVREHAGAGEVRFTNVVLLASGSA
ncbi:MAG TPA: class I SAM-dependent methyltransferase [Solirubrobacteraceae bacterium]